MSLVLVADDDPATRELVVLRLQADGHECVAVENGAGALAAVRERVPALAVLDVNMPGMSGFDVCRELRREPALGRLPILILTASIRSGDVTEGFGSGADDYLVKPFDPHELSEHVRALLDRASGFSIY